MILLIYPSVGPFARRIIKTTEQMFLKHVERTMSGLAASKEGNSGIFFTFYIKYMLYYTTTTLAGTFLEKK